MPSGDKLPFFFRLTPSTYLFLIALITTPAAADECRVCDDPESPYCLHLKESRYADSFKELYHIFQAPETDLISAKQLQDLFKEHNDPCHRSDTTIRKNLLTNQGNGCDMTTNLSLSSDKTVKVKITIPADLYSSMLKSEKAVNFKTIGWPIVLAIDDPDLEADWGGDVSRLVLTEKYARIPRIRGCIQYDFH